ncbi:MAG: DNA integrity scanning diadenylate cyclase DisA [Peptococcaceae bacterium]
MERISGKKSELINLLKKTAPGTPLREGLDNVLRAKTGGLIVLTDDPSINDLVTGGFVIDCPYSPASLYELAKMDGAIILNKDATKILRANAHLNPDPSVPSFETGIRHRTAEKVARQLDVLVVCISQRRNVITLFKGDIKYYVKESNVLVGMANQAVQTLDKYKTVLDKALNNLSVLEYDGMVSITDVAKVLQRAEMFARVEEELSKYISELGSEGRLIQMQVEELIANVDRDEERTVMDYENWGGQKSVDEILKRLRNLKAEDLLHLDIFARELGYEIGKDQDSILITRGYRLLNRIPRLPFGVIQNMIHYFGSFSRIQQATVEELDEVEGIGETRAKIIKDGLKRMRDQIYSEFHYI